MEFKSGYVSLIGKPNTGKSTILNAIIGEKLAAISDKAQTTRNRISGIYNSEASQIIFLDTPGIHEPETKLGEYMMKTVIKSLKDVDIVLFVFDDEFIIPREIEELSDVNLLSTIKDIPKTTKVFVVINKTDLIPIQKFKKYKEYFEKIEIVDDVVGVSALENEGVKELVHLIEKTLPAGPRYYPEDIYTNMSHRDIVCEIIREKILKYMDKEIPHGTAVSILSFKERVNAKNTKIFDIESEIICEKESHKGMIIGKNGRKLKGIGAAARKDIEKSIGEKVNLKLWVKIKNKWRNNPGELKRRGYDIKNI